ncbi:MAG: divalent-cation tolerance protein CutA [Deltaproteobacteria bacterium]|nr:divalent-cation tolerance protein CutA [Deltaproteobacteria bacterium]
MVAVGMIKDAISVLSTIGSKKEAQALAKILIKEKLAACVQIVPGLESFYFWQNKLCQDKEVLVIIKTRRILFSKLVKTIKKNHSYEIPQILALPIVGATSSYFQWMKNSLASK